MRTKAPSRPGRLRAAGFAAASLTIAGCAVAAPVDDYFKGFQAAEAENRTFPPITEVDGAATMDQAYAVQKRIVAARAAKGDRPVGYKGGLMSAKSLADRKVSEPLTAVLFASGDTASGATFDLCNYRRAAFEMKIGYVFKGPVSKPVASVAELRGLIAHVQPVVDLPDISYRDDKTYGAIDMVAANVSASRFVRGAPSQRFDGLDDVEAAMTRDGAAVTKGRGRESLGDQWESLRRVTNLILAHGGTIRPGTLVITGKIGDKGDVTPGEYVADYGALGAVRFKAAACGRR